MITPNRKKIPLFDDKCKEAIELYVEAIKTSKKETIISSLINYKVYWAKACKAIKEAQKRATGKNMSEKLIYFTKAKEGKWY